MRKLLFTASFVLGALCAPLFAQQTPAPDEAPHLNLTLHEAQQYALNHNYSLLNADIDLKKSEVDKWNALGSLIPQVSTGFDYANMCGYELNLGMASIAMNPSGTFNLQVAEAVTGAQIVGVLISKIAFEMTNINAQLSAQSVRSNVKNVYVNILVMEQTMGLLDSNLAYMDRMVQSTQSAVNAGAAEQVDADKLTVQVATLRSSISTTKNTLALLYNTLILQMGAPANSTITLKTKLDDIVNVKQATSLTSSNFDINNNYTYQLVSKSEELADKQVTMQYVSFLPTLTAYYQYSSKTYFGKDAGFNTTPPNMVGVSLKWDLYKGGTRYHSLHKAKLDYEAAVNTRRQTEQALQVQLNQLRYDLVSAIENYTIQQQSINVAKKVLENVTEKYRYGRASSLEVTNASTSLVSAQSSYIQAVTKVITAQTSLQDLLCTE